MDVIVYVETNFLMSVAMGREARGDDLLAAVSGSEGAKGTFRILKS